MSFLSRFRRGNQIEPECPGFHVKDEELKPCSGQPDQELSTGAPPDETRRVVTLVHGTFAQHAKWIRDGEPLCNKLRELPGTRLSRFCWSGANTHTARLQAGQDLAIHLRRLISEFPNAKHFVAAHSHGGNVALYAMEDKNPGDDKKLGDCPSIGGIITLATPFLVLRKRLLPDFVLPSAWIAIVFVLVASILIGIAPASPGTQNTGAEQSQQTPAEREKQTEADKQDLKERQAVAWSAMAWLAGLSLLWLVATTVSALMYCRGAFGLTRLFRLLLARKKMPDPGQLHDQEHLRNEQLDRELQEMLVRLQPEGTIANRLLVVRPLGDEASMGLVVSQFFSWAQNRLLRLLQTTHDLFLGRSVTTQKPAGCKPRVTGCFFAVVKLVVIIVLALVLNAYFSPAVDAVADWCMTLLGKRFELIIVFVLLLFMGLLAFFLIFGFVSLLGMLGLLLAALPFGVDAMFWNHFASTTAETSPLGTHPAEIFVAGGQSSSGLAHSGIYVHRETIQQIADWISSRSEDDSPA